MKGLGPRVFVLLSLASVSIDRGLAQGQYVGPSILPASPEAIDGGNPFQGLGRSDDPGPSRERQYGFPSYNNSGFNANGMHDYPAPSFISDSWAAYPHSDGTNSNAGVSSTGSNQSSAGPGAANNQSGFIPTSVLDTPSSSNQGGLSGAYPAPQGAGGTANSSVSQQNGNQANPQFAPGFAGQAGFGSGPSGPGAGAGPGAAPVGGNGNDGNAVNAGSNAGTGVGGTGVSRAGAPNGATPAGGFGSASTGFGAASQNAQAYNQRSGLPLQGFPNPDHRERADADKFGKGSEILTPLTENGTFDAGPTASFGQNADSPSEPTLPSSRDALSFAENADRSGKQIKGSLSSPLDKMKAGRLQDALNDVNQILQSDSGNANAHYLKAVICVLTRNFEAAKREYEQTLKLSHNEQLTDRAKTGLNKLSVNRTNH